MYIVRKGIEYFFPKIDENFMNKVIEILDSDEKKIFLEMDRYDKFHSLEVYKKLSETTLKDEIIYLKLALLHDCGKGKTSMITRVLHKFKIKTPLREHAERGYEKIKDIELLGGHPQPEELRRILSRRVRSEKVAWKDIKLRTFIAEGNSRKDLAAHVYDITYESLVAYKDNLVIIDDSIVRGTTLRESVIRILDRLHPKRIVIVSASPQVRYPDFYGIDMPDLAEFISFRAIIALLKQYGKEDIIRSVYKRCKEQEGRPKEEMQEYVRELYAECSGDEISKKTAELLRPEGVQTEIHIVYQTLEGLHKACPLAPGDWYFSGHYPTPGGRMRVNQAFINFYERNEAQLNQKQFNL